MLRYALLMSKTRAQLFNLKFVKMARNEPKKDGPKGKHEFKLDEGWYKELSATGLTRWLVDSGFEVFPQ